MRETHNEREKKCQFVNYLFIENKIIISMERRILTAIFDDEREFSWQSHITNMSDTSINCLFLSLYRSFPLLHQTLPQSVDNNDAEWIALFTELRTFFFFFFYSHKCIMKTIDIFAYCQSWMSQTRRAIRISLPEIAVLSFFVTNYFNNFSFVWLSIFPNWVCCVRLLFRLGECECCFFSSFAFFLTLKPHIQRRTPIAWTIQQEF